MRSFAMPTKEIPITLTPAEKGNRSIDPIWDEIAALAEHKRSLAVCAVAAIGLGVLLGLVLATVTSNGSAGLFAQPPAEPPARAQIDPLQMMTNAKDLPAAGYDDYSLVFN
jgi:hypothetical protein